MRGSLSGLCKCGSVWKCMKQLHPKQPPIKLLSHSLLKILITELYEIASVLHMWQVTEQQRDAETGGWTGTAEELLLIGPVTLWVQIAADKHEQARGGKGKYVFAFRFRPHTGFLLDDRWHASHPAHCRYHSAQPVPSPSLPPFYLTSPSGYCVIPILPHTHMHPYIVYFSISMSSFPALKP